MYVSFFKRIFDVVVGSLSLIVFLPILLCILLISCVAHRSFRAFFIQTRIGYHNKPFKIIKLRTMSNEKDGENRLLDDESRITPFGLFLRRTSIDELPQLLNIIKGDMSLVGPRPFVPEDCAAHGTPAQMTERHSVRPGLTGLAQVNGRNAINFEQRIQYDLAYIKSVSFLLDAQILFRTFRVIFEKRTL